MREIIAKMVIDDTNYERAESQTEESKPALETVADIFETLPARFKSEESAKNLMYISNSLPTITQYLLRTEN